LRPKAPIKFGVAVPSAASAGIAQDNAAMARQIWAGLNGMNPEKRQAEGRANMPVSGNIIMHIGGREQRLQPPSFVILSAAKDLMGLAIGRRSFRCAQDDREEAISGLA
jgi:hypothetical protein